MIMSFYISKAAQKRTYLKMFTNIFIKNIIITDIFMYFKYFFLIIGGRFFYFGNDTYLNIDI